MRRTTACCIALLLVFGTGCYQMESRVVARIDQSWDAADLESLNLKTVNGRVESTRGEADVVRVVAEVRSPRNTEREIVKFSEGGSTLTVREDWPSRGRGVFPFSFRSPQGDVRYEIEVPERLELEVSTTNGRIETTGIRGAQVLASVNGRIEIDTPDASVSARTVNGRVVARFSETFHGATLKTVNGSVRVYVPSGTRLTADVNQVNGSFHSKLPVVVNASNGTGGSLLKVTTVNGSVTLDELGGE
jgi:hypothetical protein